MTNGKRWSCCAAAALMFVSQANTSRAAEGAWVPSAVEIENLEHNLTRGPSQPTASRPPFGKITAEDLKISARYYFGEVYAGTKVIRGEILRGRDEKGGITIQADMPIVMDGGCSVINLLYDPKLRTFVRFECNGLA